MSDTTAPASAMPDRLSTDPRSPFYDADLLGRGVGIRFKGEEKTNVEEYCVSEGWVRLALGNKVDRHGRPLTIKLTGDVEPYPATTADKAAALAPRRVELGDRVGRQGQPGRRR